MTDRGKSVIASAMVRRTFLLLWTIVASLTAASMVHANETSSASAIECSGYVHGDGDPSPGEADKAVPHHHGGCHSAASLLPRTTAPIFFDTQAAPKTAAPCRAFGRWAPGPDLRPPIA
ncbi:hypothetical protein sphantq_02441 [Sphingobium sp. AntQ-1]|nr:hypothetical protein sphantq_02441 [Sphingobium sp. AntQ-1]